FQRRQSLVTNAEAQGALADSGCQPGHWRSMEVRPHARPVRLRVAAVVVALVVLPAVVFAVARDHRAAPAVSGWTAYPQDVQAWAARHPNGTCNVTATGTSCIAVSSNGGASGLITGP